MSAFGVHLRSLLQDQLGIRGFARKAGISHVSVSLICRGHRTPKLGSVEQWSIILGLSGTRRSRFINLAALAHLPPEVERRFIRILDINERLIIEKYELQEMVERYMKKYGSLST